MHPSTVLTVAWLPLVLLYSDQRASALLPDSPVQIRSSQASKSCSPSVITTRSVRFYSIKTAGGSLYVRHHISQDLQYCFQAAGEAVNEAAKDFATCANTAEKKKKNVFQFTNGVCTSYASMLPSALLPSCSGVGDVVVYVVKTALNKATVPCPAPKVTDIKLSSNPNRITATWTVQDVSNLTKSCTVTVQTFGSVLVVSTDGVHVTNNASSVSTVIIPAGVMTYDIYGVTPCSNTSVTVTPQYSDGKYNGTSMTVSTLEMEPGTITTPSFDKVEYRINTFDEAIRTWYFRSCESIASYKLNYIDGSSLASKTLDTSVTTLVVLGIEVCGGYSIVWIDAINTTGAKLATTGLMYAFGDRKTNLYPWPTQSACFAGIYISMTFSDALAYCPTVRGSELFSYGGDKYLNINEVSHNLNSGAWVDLQYSPTTDQWVWGNKEVEPKNSSLWLIAPDPARGHCAVADNSGNLAVNYPLFVVDCTELHSVMCFKFY